VKILLIGELGLVPVRDDAIQVLDENQALFRKHKTW
jgi:hypothetical protein